MDRKLFLGTVKGLSLIFAYIMVDPLVKEINDTFGSTFLYHPFAVWLTISSLVYANTDNVPASLIAVFLYELAKVLWKIVRPQPPEVVKLRKLIHRAQNKEPLSAKDIEFLNDVTPKDVKVQRVT